MHPFFTHGRGGRGRCGGAGPCEQAAGREARGGGAFGGAFGGSGGGFGGGWGGGHGHGRGAYGEGGGRRERMFEAGDLKLLVLHILAGQPSHGYEVIKAIGELVGGDYSPSPGTVYPTLNLLEDMGLIVADLPEGTRKQYRLTDAGQAQREAQREATQRLLDRLGALRMRAQARRLPELQRAMENLKTALRLRFGDAEPDAALVQRVADVIDRAAAEIGRLEPR